MKQPLLSKQELAITFKVSVDRISQQYKDNAMQLRSIAYKALKSGKKYRGKTAAQWLAYADAYETIAAQ